VVVPPALVDPLELTQAGTIAVWAKFDALPSTLGGPTGEFEGLVDKGGFGTDLTLLGGGIGPAGTTVTDQVWFSVGGPAEATSAVTWNSFLTKGQWYHIVGTFKSAGQAAGQICLYVYILGASEVAPQCTSYTGPRQPDVQPLRFGDGAYFTRRGFQGLLDDIAIWDVALTPDQVQTIDALGAAGMPLSASLGD
jgi:hypothetical protein